MFSQIGADFEKYVKVNVNKVFFKTPDFEAIEVEAEKNATEKKEDGKSKRPIPGLCCDDYVEIPIYVDKVNKRKKLKEFKTMSVRHIRQEAYQFKQEIQKEVDEYMRMVNERLQDAIDTQYRHLNQLKDNYKVISRTDLQKKIEELNAEIDELKKFVDSIN